MSILDIKKMYKSYQLDNKDICILHHINLSFKSNEFVGIIGPSGSGKTTLLYTISGLEKPSKGNVILFGKDTSLMSSKETEQQRSSEIAFIFQFYNLLPNLTVYENIQIARLFSTKEEVETIDSLLESVGMLEYKDYFPNQLSGGMQQRVAIARSLVNQPKIIFADEPTGNLDVESGKQVMELLKKIQINRKVTVIMVTHNPDYLSYCTRKIELRDGKVIQDEPI
ncbi:MAG: ABC transporter ATP-binding protein [Candidatus Izemoplasmatales bacterium]